MRLGRLEPQIDFGARSLDWSVRTTITGAPGGAPADAAEGDVFTRMQGLTVPIRLSGPYDDLSYRVDVKELATEALGRELERRLQQAPVRWEMAVTLAAPGDPTADATRAWPADRERVVVGEVVVERVSPQADGDCRDVNFDPLVLPNGITASDDPLPAARSAVYARSFTRRAQEPKPPSEVNVGQVRS